MWVKQWKTVWGPSSVSCSTWQMIMVKQRNFCIFCVKASNKLPFSYVHYGFSMYNAIKQLYMIDACFTVITNLSLQIGWVVASIKCWGVLWLGESCLSLVPKGFHQSAYDHENEYFQNWASKFFLFTEWGSTKTGEQDGLIGTAMNCVLQVPKFLPQEQRFDIRVLVSYCICYINIKWFSPFFCIYLLWLQIKEQPLQFSLTIYI